MCYLPKEGLFLGYWEKKKKKGTVDYGQAG